MCPRCQLKTCRILRVCRVYLVKEAQARQFCTVWRYLALIQSGSGELAFFVPTDKPTGRQMDTHAGGVTTGKLRYSLLQWIVFTRGHNFCIHWMHKKKVVLNAQQSLLKAFGMINKFEVFAWGQRMLLWTKFSTSNIPTQGTGGVSLKLLALTVLLTST